MIGLLALFPLVVAPAISFVRLQSKKASRVARTDGSNLTARLADRPFQLLGAILLVCVILLGGAWINGLGLVKIVLVTSLIVCVILLAIWGLGRLFVYQRKFGDLVKRVQDEPNDDTLRVLLAYVRGRSPTIYRTRAAQMLADIRNPSTASIAAIHETGRQLTIPEAIRDEIWRSADNVEKRFWRNYYQRHEV